MGHNQFQFIYLFFPTHGLIANKGTLKIQNYYTELYIINKLRLAILLANNKERVNKTRKYSIMV